MGEKILVTGATGILGSEVIKQLSKDVSYSKLRHQFIHLKISKVRYPGVDAIFLGGTYF
jgi:nucleoside-diphosphate-sugar epimerase